MEILWEQNAENTVAVACSPYSICECMLWILKKCPLAGKLLTKMVASSSFFLFFGSVGFGLLHCNACLSRCGD